MIFLVIGTVFFAAIYLFTLQLLKGVLSPKRDAFCQREIANWIVSSIQAVMACIVGNKVMRNTQSNILYARDYDLNRYAWVMLGYITYDTFSMYHCHVAKRKGDSFYSFIKQNPLMMFHHLLLPCVIGPAILHFRNGKGDYLIGCALLSEATIPFVAVRFILCQVGLKNSILYVVNGVMLVISFGLCRLALWPYLVSVYAQYLNTDFTSAFLRLPLVCKCVTTILIAMNAYWFTKMVLILIRTLSKVIHGVDSSKTEKLLD